jgi:hypothetical protein
MRITALVATLAVGCSTLTAAVEDPDATPNPSDSVEGPPAAASAEGGEGGGDVVPRPGGEPYAQIYAGVDPALLQKLLQEMTGYAPVTIDAGTVRITERYTPASKALWRAYFTAYYTSLGATVREMTFPVKNLVGENVGHNLEAVFPGKSKDSVVAIVHYDSTGAPGKETENPAVDNDMTPMAIQMEAARLLSERRDRLEKTVRFVATDYEEITSLEGGKAYVADLTATAKAEGFSIAVAIDGELSGWNCFTDKKCAIKGALTIAAGTCDGAYAFPALGKQVTDLAARYSPLQVSVECDSQTNDVELYNFWRAGVPGFYFVEYGNDENDHFGANGGDTLDRIDMDYFTSIARIVAVVIANAVGVN